MKQTATLDEAIDTVELLPPEQQKMLMEILRHRLIDGRREEIAQQTQRMLAAYGDRPLRVYSA